VDDIAINATLEIDDWRALQRAAAQRLGPAATPSTAWLRMVGIALATGGALFLLDAFRHADPVAFAAGIFVMLATTVASSRLTLRRMTPEPNGAFLGPCAYTLDGAGLRAARARAHSFIDWSSVLDVTRTDDHVFVWIDRFSAYTIPARDLPEGLTAPSLATWITSQRGGVAAGAPGASAAADISATATERGGRLGDRLLELAGLVALRGKSVLVGAEGRTAASTAVLALATWAILDRWSSGSDVEFFLYGASELAWYPLGGLAVAWVLSRAAVPQIPFARAAIVVALGAWLVILYSYAGRSVGGGRWVPIGLFVLATVYMLAYLARAGRGLTGRAQPRAALAAFAATIVFFWVTEALFVSVSLWVPAEPDSYARSYRAAEPLLFSQHDKVEKALAAVPPNDTGDTELYFVGFAGDGNEKVFPEEIKFAERTVAQRYGTGARSVLLLNDQRDTETAPLATISTLRYALRGIAAKMAADDILFLALSSHGSHDWTLSVANGGLPLGDMSPDDLATALADAGIKWRVIVISACYAAGFIDALKDPFTIVLAAAAPDRTSFGCSNERELTYFGEAFYRDALPAAKSLRDAFATAKQGVLDRETAAGVARSSEPTAFFGEKIERRLAGLESHDPP
jgi:hypothetical protein